MERCKRVENGWDPPGVPEKLHGDQVREHGIQRVKCDGKKSIQDRIQCKNPFGDEEISLHPDWTEINGV